MENIELRRQNKNLAAQVQKQKQIEENLLLRISHLEEKQSEDDVILCGINRYWKILDENCRLFAKQFDTENCEQLFDKLDSNADSFLIQLSTWDIEELKEKLEKRVQLSKQSAEKMILSLYKMLIRTNTLQKLLKTRIKLKPQEVKQLQQNVKFRRKIITLHRNHYILNLRIRNKQDTLNIKETRNDELKNRADNLRYQNAKMKAVTDRMEHSLAELLDEIKSTEAAKSEKEADTVSQTASPPDSNDKGQQLENEIDMQRKISEKYLQELQMLNIKQQETAKQVEMLKIDLRQLPETVITQTKKYKHLQSKFSVLYNEATQLRLSWEEVQRQMQLLKSSFNSAQEASERECLLQQKNIRQEMIKLDDTNGQLRKECQKLKMELEQSIAENNLFGSLNSEMKKLMSSMLDYCKQHESDIKRYKRKHEEIEEDIRFSKAMPPVKIKCDKLIQLVRYREFQKRRLKEKEAIKEKMKMMPPPKELKSGREVSKELANGNDKEMQNNEEMINAKELQHIKNLLNAKDAKHCKELLRDSPLAKELAHAKLIATKESSRSKDHKEFLHPRETLKNKELAHSKEALHRDLLNSKELSHCKDLLTSTDSVGTRAAHLKIGYSKEVLRSKELLKERYLRDCSKMKFKELQKDAQHCADQKPPAMDKVQSMSEVPRLEDSGDTNKHTSKTASKEILKESGKITSIVNLDSDDSGHDEPKIRKLDDINENSLKDKSLEEFTEKAIANECQNPEKSSECTKPENKEQADVKKPAPPCKKDLIVRKLKYQLKKIMDEKKDLNLLLGMYKNMNKTDEEKVQFMVSEQKLKSELEEVKRQMRRIEESRYDDRKDLVDVVMARKIKYLLAKRRRLQKKIEEAKDSLLCGEMEITGQVWDELQAQNTRLHQLLREKDEENLKLMTERVKSNQLYNLSKEENESVMQLINFNNEKIEIKSEIIQKMEERELAYRNRLTFFEQELSIRKKACEINKRKAFENAQSTANLKRQLEKYQRSWKEILQLKSDKSALLEEQYHKNSILLDEVTQYRRKVERIKKYESIDTIEAILSEELREYKNILTCPSCKINTKDAVLIKCFHVYCLNCIKTRYETRQRKCPECCAPFGANDYHRLFLFN